MVEVTAEMIERGRGADPMVAAERRRMALHVREAREKLTSSGSGYRAFDVELLKLYAQRRKMAAPGLAGLAMALAAAALHWMAWPAALGWLAANAAGIGLSCLISTVLLGRNSDAIDVKRWTRLFFFTELAQGLLWAFVVVLASRTDEANAGSFFLIALLLVAAVNVTITATIPFAVYGLLMPITVAVIFVLHPSRLGVPDALLPALAVGTSVYFILLARKLYASMLQALLFQAEKDELIAELEQAKANSDLARLRAEESNSAKSRFLASMSHELRTPLNAILGFSEVMQAELFGPHAIPAYKDYAGDIHSSGHHLLMLINEILDLSRVEAGRYELCEEPVHLQAVMDECRHLLTLRAKKKDITIVGADGPTLPRLWVDARAMRQVALNLLSNAIKFTPQGGTVGIALGWTPEGGQFFTITDTGTGIPENEIPIVMSSFGRGSFAQKTAEEGSGLGLPIVKGLIELHGGTFDLSSRIREGTTVTVRLPSERVMSVLPRLETLDDMASQAVLRTAA
jgi:two-component system, cell cycle sensor histidine kinase PleC